MSAEIRVDDFTKMGKVADQLKATSEEYHRIYTELMEKATTIKSWEGVDNVAFTQQLQDFLPKLQAMKKKLEAAGKTIEEQKNNYKNQQEDLRRKAKKLPN